MCSLTADIIDVILSNIIKYLYRKEPNTLSNKMRAHTAYKEYNRYLIK